MFIILLNQYWDRNILANTIDKGQTVQGQQYLPFCLHFCDKFADSQIIGSQINLFFSFSMAIAEEMSSVNILKRSW